MIEGVGVVNQSRVVSRAIARRMVAACRMQAHRDYAPAWGRRRVPIRYYSAEALVPSSFALVVILDDADVAAAEGYHAETPEGREFGRVFAGPIVAQGRDLLVGRDSVCVILSHEILELLEDPYCIAWVQGPTERGGDLHALEICDPVQADAYPVSLRDGAPWVSNFVTPNWIDGDEGRAFDFMGTCPKAFGLAPGGWKIMRDAQGNEREIFAKQKPPAWRLASREHPAARTARRRARCAARRRRATGVK